MFSLKMVNAKTIIDNTKTSKVCVTKKAVKYCVKSNAKEIEQCLKFVKKDYATKILFQHNSLFRSNSN